MIEAWFFERFELIAHAPDAVAKMRELVLELAVQGKLVPQEPDDESAAVLLKRIHADCSETTKRRGLRRKDTVAAVVPPYFLPNGWTWTSLGSIADWGSGSTPPRDNYELYGGSITWLKSGELNDNRALAGSDEQVTELAVKQGSFRHNKPGDVLFAMYGATVGKAAILAEPAVTNQAVCGCTPCSGVLNHYLFFYLVSQRQKFRNASEGGAQPNFSKDKILLYPFPLPPLAEQKRIVAKVDELMALCDQLEAQQQERETRKSVLVRASLTRFAETPTPANLGFLFYKSYDVPPAELRKTILTLAVQGKLVPQDSADESVDELLVRSHEERRKLNRTVVAAARHLRENEGLGYRIPTSWRWQLLDELLVFGPTNGFSPRAVDYETPTRSLTLSATTSGRFKGEYSKFIAAEVPHDSDLWLRDGDILIQRGNTSDYVGVAAVYRGEPNRFVYPDLMMKVRVSSCFDVAFIHLAMSEDAARNFLRRRATGTSSNMPKINQTTLRCLPLPVPPHSEQCRIVAKVDQLMSLVDELERQQELSRTTASRLLDAIVHELTGDR